MDLACFLPETLSKRCYPSSGYLKASSGQHDSLAGWCWLTKMPLFLEICLQRCLSFLTWWPPSLRQRRVYSRRGYVAQRLFHTLWHYRPVQTWSERRLSKCKNARGGGSLVAFLDASDLDEGDGDGENWSDWIYKWG